MSEPTWTTTVRPSVRPGCTVVTVINVSRNTDNGELTIQNEDVADFRGRLEAMPILDTTDQGDWIKALPGHAGEVELHDRLAKELEITE